MSHSQGGQTLYPNAIMIDMKQYNKIINLDKKNKNDNCSKWGHMG